MRQFKTFIFTFTVTFCIMLTCYMGLYWFVQYTSPQAAGETQENVPILSLTPEDTKTVLVVTECDEARFYFLLQLNAIQNKVNLVSVPSAYYLSAAQRTLGESMDYAGVRQCVQDLSRQFDITIDFYLVCSVQQMAQLTESFTDIDTDMVDIPQSVRQYVLKNSRYVDMDTLAEAVNACGAVLDNVVGIEFINTAGAFLLENNIAMLENEVPQNIKKYYSQLNTDISTQALDRLKRIIGLLGRGEIEYGRLVMDGDETDIEQQLESLMKE